jgi:hypothetical protein
LPVLGGTRTWSRIANTKPVEVPLTLGTANHAWARRRTANQLEELIGPNRGEISPFGHNIAQKVLNGPYRILDLMNFDFLEVEFDFGFFLV